MLRILRLDTMTRRHALRDDQWERIKDLLPGYKKVYGSRFLTGFLRHLIMNMPC